MLATHSLWQESVHVCFCRDTAGQGGGEPHPDSEVSGAPRTAELWQGWDVGSGRAASASPLANMQDSRWKQGRQNQVGLGETRGVWARSGRQTSGSLTVAQALPAFLCL